jgi:ribosome recycling factor
VSDVTDAELVEAMEKMAKASDHLREEFAAVRTGRAAPALVEKIRVEYYGSDTPLQQLASFSVPEARMLVVAPYDKSSLKAIEKAIMNSDLGITPSNDGVVIRLGFPPLTQERRKDLVKVVRGKAEDARVAVRNVRRHARQVLEAAEKEGSVTANELERAEKELEKVTHDAVGEIDKMLAHKEHELLEV